MAHNHIEQQGPKWIRAKHLPPNPHFVNILLDSGDSGRIDYDEKAIMSLLDRTSSHDDAPDEERDIMANEYLASFKVKQNGRVSQKMF